MKRNSRVSVSSYCCALFGTPEAYGILQTRLLTDASRHEFHLGYRNYLRTKTNYCIVRVHEDKLVWVVRAS